MTDHSNRYCFSGYLAGLKKSIEGIGKWGRVAGGFFSGTPVWVRKSWEAWYAFISRAVSEF